MNILLLPFRICWSFICLLFNLTGRLLGAVIGLALMVTGLFLTFTVVAAVIGIPLAIMGLLLTIRSLFK